MIDEQTIERIREGMPEIIEKLYGITDLRRPFRCLSRDHEDSTPSCHFYPNSSSAWCFGCGRNFDSFTAVGEALGIDGFAEQARAAADILGISLDEAGAPPKPKPAPKPRPLFDPPRETGAQNCWEECGRAFGDLYAHGNEVGRRYLRWRGLDDDDIAALGLGFTRFPKAIMHQFSVNEPEALGFITIPFWNRRFTEARYCMVRTVSRGKVRNKEWRPKGVSSPLYNEWMLSASLPVVYVTEGLIDAMAMRKIQEGKPVMALGGTSNAKRFAQVLYHTPVNMRPKKVIVCMDEDDEGRKTRERMCADLDVIGVPHAYLQPYPDGAKDADEWLMNGRDKDWEFYEKPPDPATGLVLVGTRWRTDGR